MEGEEIVINKAVTDPNIIRDIIKVYVELRITAFTAVEYLKTQYIVEKIIKDEGVYDQLNLLERKQEITDKLFDLMWEFGKMLEKILMIKILPPHIAFVEPEKFEEALKEKVYRPKIIIQVTTQDHFWIKLPEDQILKIKLF